MKYALLFISIITLFSCTKDQKEKVIVYSAVSMNGQLPSYFPGYYDISITTTRKVNLSGNISVSWSVQSNDGTWRRIKSNVDFVLKDTSMTDINSQIPQLKTDVNLKNIKVEGYVINPNPYNVEVWQY